MTMTDLTRIFSDFAAGDPGAADKLLEIVYDELRQLASRKLAREEPGITLQPTALVHEAWLRIGGQSDADWRDRSYFFAASGEAMRRILVENARARGRLKRGGDRGRVELDSGLAVADSNSLDLLALDEALNKLAQESPRKARLVELRFFAGMEIEEAAMALSISRATADRDWAYAKAFLHHEISEQTNED
ncbi:MAG: RNA polymerase sigma factor (TIGR02999 family) [Planctomycetota bacterium]|jgi:RNA polymerase sigma factor (TIGR02999 family)